MTFFWSSLISSQYLLFNAINFRRKEIFTVPDTFSFLFIQMVLLLVQIKIIMVNDTETKVSYPTPNGS